MKMRTFLREEVYQIEHELMDYCTSAKTIDDATAQRLSAIATGIKLTIDAVLEKFDAER